MVHTVYEAINAVNGHRYIGNTGRTLAIRKKRHFWVAAHGRGAKLGFAIRLYGPDSFVFWPLVICPDMGYANYVERALIALYKPEYNIQAGGSVIATYSLSDEAKKKISSAHKGKQFWLGKKHKEDTKAKMSKARAKYWASREHSRKKYQKKETPRRGKVIVCNGVVYESVCHAARANGLSREQLRCALERKTNTGVISGLRFKEVVLSVAP